MGLWVQYTSLQLTNDHHQLSAAYGAGHSGLRILISAECRGTVLITVVPAFRPL